jgi:hypothetical protein
VTVFGFVISQAFTRAFWYLFLASFTMVMMLAWRAHLRDQIFKVAAGKFMRPRF